MKIKGIVLVSTLAALCAAMTGCTEADRVSYNVSKDADNFNVIRRLTVMNARTDTIMYEMEGQFSIAVDAEENQLEITCETDDEIYKKHFVGLNDYTMYVVEDIGGAAVDQYHYTVNYLPEGNIINFHFEEND